MEKLAAGGGTSNQVLSNLGGVLFWKDDLQGGVTLPYSGSYSTSVATFQITNEGSGKAIYGRAPGTATAVYGGAQDGVGAYATSHSNNAVYGRTSGSNKAGVYGKGMGTLGFGVYGESSAGLGVVGKNTFHGTTGGLGYMDIAVFGDDGGNSNKFAGGFNGKVDIDGDLHVSGTVTAPSRASKIDNPLDPENKYLSHSFVESPDMKNVYDGNVVLDGNGEAVVELPDWFEALNRDFRYQLTPLSGPMPNLWIGQKVEDDRFAISGGTPGGEVSWQVTGIRRDPWDEAHRIPVEETKPETERGLYLHPELYGQPRERGIAWARLPDASDGMAPQTPAGR